MTASQYLAAWRTHFGPTWQPSAWDRTFAALLAAHDQRTQGGTD